MAEAFNVKVDERSKMVDAYGARADAYNASVEKLQDERATFAQQCGNRRYFEDDETAIKKGK
jgi:hypothetical protein